MSSLPILQVLFWLSPSMEHEGEHPNQPDWVLEYDRRTGHFYYFNTKTGESRWAEEDDDVAGHGDIEEVIADPVGAISSESNQLKRRGGKGQYMLEEEEDDDEEEGEGGQGGPNTIMLEASRKGAEIHRRTQGIVLAFTAMFYFHGCCCEGPLAVIEGLLRAPVYFIGAFVYFCAFLATQRRDQWDFAASWFGEGSLLLAASISLIIPGMALCIYKDFHPDAEEWELSGIPTILGHVDPRRFYTFSHGQGSMASNAFYDSDIGSMDSMGRRKVILHPPKSLVIARGFEEVAQEYNNNQSSDCNNTRSRNGSRSGSLSSKGPPPPSGLTAPAYQEEGRVDIHSSEESEQEGDEGFSGHSREPRMDKRIQLSTSNRAYQEI